MQKNPFQPFQTLHKNEIIGIYLKYKESVFEFDFETLMFSKAELPEGAKPFDLDDLEYVPKELEWAADCLKSSNPVIWTSIETGIVRFGRPSRAAKIPDELEAALFPRHTLVKNPEPPAKKASCDYFDEYDGKKKKKK